MPILSNLSEQQLFQLAGRMANREYGSGQEVFRKGEEGDTFYIVEEGTFRWGAGQMISGVGKGEERRATFYIVEEGLFRWAEWDQHNRDSSLLETECGVQVQFVRRHTQPHVLLHVHSPLPTSHPHHPSASSLSHPNLPPTPTTRPQRGGRQQPRAGQVRQGPVLWRAGAAGDHAAVRL